ncbi:MAG: NifB/NifX family molybdenum-iron cluster-binding protein [Halobacteriota archaeon]
MCEPPQPESSYDGANIYSCMTRGARRRRCVGFQPNFLYFEPSTCMRGFPPHGTGEEILKVEELESIRLKDYLQMDQAEAALCMGISQPTFHRIITETHCKIAQALVEGKAIRIEGGNYVIVERKQIKKGKEKRRMKICVTATAGDLNAQVDPRFGRSQYFVIVDSETMGFEAMANEAIAAPGGAGIQAAQAVVNTGANVVISGNIGPNAFQVLSTAGVKIATGAYGTVKEAVEMYKTGKLSEAGASTVSAHAGMGATAPGGGSGMGMGGGRGGGGGRGMGRGMRFGMQQPSQQPQAPQPPITPRTEEEEIEQLSNMANRLERELEEVKKRLEELRK